MESKTVVEPKQTKAQPKFTTPKDLHNVDTETNLPDVELVGDGEAFQTLMTISSEKEGWRGSVTAMQAGAGCVVQTSTQQRNPDGSYALSQALTYVPGVRVGPLKLDGGRSLLPIK